MISIVIPVLNNVGGLKRTLASLVPEKEGHEVLVVDGGSLDGGLEWARGTPWVKLIRSQGTAGHRKNTGAARAGGSILLFLEAGTILERGWSKAVESAASRPDFGLGCFRMEVMDPNPVFRLIETVSSFRTRWFQLARGRQVQFVNTADVQHAQVFLDIPALEDVDLSRRRRSVGRVVQLGLCAMVPASRWREAGVVSRVWRDGWTLWKWRRGVQPTRLAAIGGDKQHAILLFVKNPEPGKVKKWLGGLIGAERAARVYRRTIDEVLATVGRAKLDAETYVFFQPKNARQDLHRWLGNSAMLIGTTGRSDRDRRKNGVQTAFEMNASKALILGPHCPAVSSRELRRAMRALDDVDVVLGPTDDGGCYLVGVKQPHGELFDELDWDPDSTHAEWVRLAQEHRLSCTSLTKLRDFDSEADLAYNWAMGFVQD